jgi:hypothetical protein
MAKAARSVKARVAQKGLNKFNKRKGQLPKRAVKKGAANRRVGS